VDGRRALYDLSSIGEREVAVGGPRHRNRLVQRDHLDKRRIGDRENAILLGRVPRDATDRLACLIRCVVRIIRSETPMLCTCVQGEEAYFGRVACT
jgi:hypothetical protein